MSSNNKPDSKAQWKVKNLPNSQLIPTQSESHKVVPPAVGWTI
jgi:hypothetical protein